MKREQGAKRNEKEAVKLVKRSEHLNIEGSGEQISAPQRVGFLSNVPPRLGFLATKCARQGVVFPAIMPERVQMS